MLSVAEKLFRVGLKALAQTVHDVLQPARLSKALLMQNSGCRLHTFYML